MKTYSANHGSVEAVPAASHQAHFKAPARLPGIGARASRRWGMALGGALLALVSAAPAEAKLEAGAGRAEIALTPAMLPLDGFTAVHDPIFARAVVLSQGSARVAIVVVDMTSIGSDAVADMQAAVARAAKLQPSDVLIIASHSFSVPHMFKGAQLPPGMTMTTEGQARATAYHEAVMAAVSRAAEEAALSARPASLRFAETLADVNVNRNVPMADGWWLGTNDSEPSDKTLGLLRVDGVDGKPVAILLNYAVQSAVMDHSIGAGGGKGVTADLAGAVVAHVEGRFGEGAVSLFLTGAAGDQAPGYTARTNRYDKDGHFKTVDIGDRGYALLGPQGGRLGEAAVRAAQSAPTLADPPVLRITTGSVSLDAQRRPSYPQQIAPTRTYPFTVSGKVEAPFYVLQIGDTAVVGVQAELSSETGRFIRKHSPFAHTLVVTMVNGAAKYMPDAASYQKITYEAMNSSYGAGSAEIFRARIVASLKKIRAKRR